MQSLNAVLWALGLVCVLDGGFGLMAPTRARRVLAAFPRNRTAGWVLTAIVLGWSGYLIYHGPLGAIEPYRNALYVLTPVAVLLIVCFVEELLAARALGGLLILLPTPMLAVVRWHPSDWRLIPIVAAYLMVIVGAWLVAAPYVFRKAVDRSMPNDGACRRWAGVACAFGVLCIALAMTIPPVP